MDEKKKAKLGTRWTCFSCSGAFYDLNKPDPVCPRCGADQRDTPKAEPPKAKRKRKAAKKKKPAINPKLVEEDEPMVDESAGDLEFDNDNDSSDDENLQLEVEED